MADYTVLARWLHRLALSGKAVPELAFDLERSMFGAGLVARDAVYVTGLARSGSTALMRALHDSGGFASLTYADMPFVTAPNAWHSLNRRTGGIRIGGGRERSHGDGILVDEGSPEAFEEVFWRMRCGEDFIRPDRLEEHEVSPGTVAELRTLHSLVCRRHGADRYLAKDNNMVLRLASLAPKTPWATYVITFRDPVAQATSLQRQHARFAAADRFTRRYMEWLCHHEFGATHRPFSFVDRAAPAGLPSTVDYWLQRWIDAYDHLLRLLRAGHVNLIAADHQALCEDDSYRERLFQRLGATATSASFRSAPTTVDRTDPSLADRAAAIHADLQAFARSPPPSGSSIVKAGENGTLAR